MGVRGKKMKITKVIGREILDSRGDPTVEVELTSDSTKTIASVPSGASVGSHEALELRDNDPKRFNGMGVLKAIENVNNVISPAITGQEIIRQKDIDQTLIDLDQSEHRSKLGANAMLAVSIAFCKALAGEKKLPLYRYIAELSSNSAFRIPYPMFNFIEGAKHADNNLQIQEFLVIPEQSSFKESYRQASESFHGLKKILQEKKLGTAVGYEGGFAPMLKGDEQALELILACGKFRLALDMAGVIPQGLTIEQLLTKFPITSLEDPLGDSDWQGWVELVKTYGNKALIVGDDLLATNSALLKQAIEQKAVNAVIIKPNQIGTVTETIAFASQAKQASFRTIVSHRSGESEDTFIADFAVGVGADFVKFGAPSRGERIAKYNRLLRIEEELNVPK